MSIALEPSRKQANRAARFWRTVARAGDNECWEWKGRRDRKGYGRTNWHKLTTRAHRIAWQLTHGPIPDGLIVCHHCDNPPCANPAHLFVGTHLDNARDKVAKNRQARFPGERNRGGGKLTNGAVRAIREARAHGVPYKYLAKKHGISVRMAFLVAKRLAWAHIE